MDQNTTPQQPAPQAPAATQTPAQPTVAILPQQRPPEQIITELRARVNAGQALTREQVREALAALRQNRMTAAEASGGKKKAPAAPARSATELLAGLKSKMVGEGQGG